MSRFLLSSSLLFHSDPLWGKKSTERMIKQTDQILQRIVSTALIISVPLTVVYPLSLILSFRRLKELKLKRNDRRAAQSIIPIIT